jgi:hypothetical protein
MTKFKVQIQFDIREGDYYIPIPDEMLGTIADLGWTMEDTFEWIDNKDGTITLKKKENNDE